MAPTPKAIILSRKRLFATFIISMLAVGAYWWPPSYSEIQIIPSWWVFAFISVLVAALFAVGSLKHSLLIGVTAAGGAIAAIVIRIAVDVVGDPTSHNLWPFELALAGIFILPSALLGAAVGMVARRVFSRP